MYSSGVESKYGAPCSDDTWRGEAQWQCGIGGWRVQADGVRECRQEVQQVKTDERAGREDSVPLAS